MIKQLRRAADMVDALGVVRRGDRAFDQRQVVAAFHDRARRLREIGDVHRAGESQQLVLAVEQAELAAVARGEFPDGQFGFALAAAMSDLPDCRTVRFTRS